jgi:hypothetical protein
MTYTVTHRYGSRRTASLAEARQIQRDELADGCVSTIRRISDGEVVR